MSKNSWQTSKQMKDSEMVQKFTRMKTLLVESIEQLKIQKEMLIKKREDGSKMGE